MRSALVSEQLRRTAERIQCVPYGEKYNGDTK